MLRPKIILWIIVLGFAACVGGLFAFRNYQSRQRNEMHACRSNMRQIDSAKEQWARGAAPSYGKEVQKGTEPDTNQVCMYLHSSKLPLCPEAKVKENTYSLGRIGEEPGCSIHGLMSNLHLPDGTKP